MTGLLTRRNGGLAAAPVTAFDPLTLSPTAWWKADAITGLVNNDPCGSWLDSSGNSRTVASSGTNRPTYNTAVQNGLPAVDFDGSDDYLNVASFPWGTTSFVCIAVIRIDVAGNFRPWVGDQNGFDEMQLQNSGHGLQTLGGSSFVACGTGAFHVVTGKHIASTSRNIRLDGGAWTTASTTDIGHGTRTLTLGSDFSGGGQANVTLGEVIIKTGTVWTDAECAQLEASFKTKWATP